MAKKCGKRQRNKIDFSMFKPKVKKKNFLTDFIDTLPSKIANKLLEEMQHGVQAREPPDRSHGKPLVWGYVRVSKEEQKQSGLSIAHQEIQAKEFYDRELAATGAVWDGFLADEAVSAFKKTLFLRPYGVWLFQHMREGDHVVILRCDRVFRSMLDQEHVTQVFMARGINMHLTDCPLPWDTANGKLILQIMCAVAQWEATMIGERTKAALAISRAKGHRPGGIVPLGYKAAKSREKKHTWAPDWPTRSILCAVWRASRETRYYSFHDLARRYQAALDTMPDFKKIAEACYLKGKIPDHAIRYALHAFQRVCLNEGKDWIELTPVVTLPEAPPEEPKPRWRSEVFPEIIRTSASESHGSDPKRYMRKMGLL